MGSDAEKAAALTAWMRAHFRQLQLGHAHWRQPRPPAQVFADRYGDSKDQSWLLTVMLRAVGVLQLEVVQHRLLSEYGAKVELDRLSYKHARWVEGETFDANKFERSGRSTCVVDVEGRPLVLFASDSAMR